MRELKCVACGCTESRACVDGCSWLSIDPPICDRCGGDEPFVVADLPGGTWHIIGPGPDGSSRLIDVEAADEAEARRWVLLLNRVHFGGARAAMAIAKALSRANLKGDLPLVRKRRRR